MGRTSEELLFIPQQVHRFFHSPVSRLALGHSQPPDSPDVKRSEREADHLRTSIAKISDEWNYTFTSPIMPLWRVQGHLNLNFTQNLSQPKDNYALFPE